MAIFRPAPTEPAARTILPYPAPPPRIVPFRPYPQPGRPNPESIYPTPPVSRYVDFPDTDAGRMDQEFHESQKAPVVKAPAEAPAAPPRPSTSPQRIDEMLRSTGTTVPPPGPLREQHRTGFLEALRANPLDHGIRAQFSDWLEEGDEPHEAARQRWMAATGSRLRDLHTLATPAFHLGYLRHFYSNMAADPSRPEHADADSHAWRLHALQDFTEPDGPREHLPGLGGTGYGVQHTQVSGHVPNQGTYEQILHPQLPLYQEHQAAQQTAELARQRAALAGIDVGTYQRTGEPDRYASFFDEPDLPEPSPRLGVHVQRPGGGGLPEPIAPPRPAQPAAAPAPRPATAPPAAPARVPAAPAALPTQAEFVGPQAKWRQWQGTGANPNSLVTVRGRRYFAKAPRDPVELRSEHAASQLQQLLGLPGAVPVAIVIDNQGVQHVVTPHVPGENVHDLRAAAGGGRESWESANRELDRRVRSVPQEKLAALGWFNWLVNSGDRHAGNYIYRQGDVTAIDHGFSFWPQTATWGNWGGRDKLFGTEEGGYRPDEVKAMPVDRRLLEAALANKDAIMGLVQQAVSAHPRSGKYSQARALAHYEKKFQLIERVLRAKGQPTLADFGVDGNLPIPS